MSYSPERLMELADLVACDMGRDEDDAANALRAYAATLRQQAGVDEDGLVKAGSKLFEAMEMQERRELGTFHISQPSAKAIWDEAKKNWRAALAQNTRGEVVADGPSDSDVQRACHRYYNAGFAVALPRPEAMRAALTSYHKRLHAERAMVPDGWVLVRKASLGYWLRELNGARQGDNAHQRAELVHSGIATYLAAASSQPEDAESGA